MKLATLFDALGPLLAGDPAHASEPDAVRALFPAVDAPRVALYAGFCRDVRRAMLDAAYPLCRAAVLARGDDGETRWAALCEAYARAHPATHFVPIENAAALHAFLRARGESYGVPAWLAELADLEWHQHRAAIALEAPGATSACDGGAASAQRRALRVAPGAVVRRYTHDLVAWLEQSADACAASGSPEPATSAVLVWRGTDLEVRRANVGVLEIAVLDAIAAGVSLERACAQVPDASPEEIADVLADLVDAGAVSRA